ncbi:DUF2771 family protein [Gordonia sp. CPCC 206044]|uniref:DUF2771 family protein n=1 Tax=Gordonia sp. CPCC 206044 TaxID=3140793 RepID=UPI003AF3FE84
MRSGEKKALTIIAAVAVVFVLVVGGTVAFLTRDVWSGDSNDDDDLYLQLAVGDRLIRVEPTLMCDIFLKNCSPSDPRDISVQRVPIPIGESVLVSASKDVAEWPWNLVVQYLTPRGPEVTSTPMRSESTYTTALHSTPDRVVVNIEVQIPSAVTEPGTDNVMARGFLAADTTPENLPERPVTQG